MKIETANTAGGDLIRKISSGSILKCAFLRTCTLQLWWLALVAIVVSEDSAKATVLAGWNVSAQSNYGISPLAATAGDPNLTVGGLTRGAGVGTTGTATSRAWGGVNWTNATDSAAIAADRVVTFSVSPNTGYTVSFTNIILSYRRSSSGATTGRVQYQIDAGSFFDIGPVAYTVSASAGATLPAIDLSGISALQNIASGTTVTFRIVNYGGTSTNGTWYVYDVANSPASDLEVNGTIVSPGVPPSVTDITPASITANAGSTAAFTVTATGDASAYFWYKETATTNLIPSATTATLTLSNILAADTANYHVILSNVYGMSTSAVVSLTVIDPAILTQSSSQSDLVGSTVALKVNASGTPPLTYQWYQGQPEPGVNTTVNDTGQFSGAQTSMLTISNLALADANDYFAIVTSSAGAVTSSVVTLGVASSGPLVRWDFNAIDLNPASPAPLQGQAFAAATPVGTTNSLLTSDNGAGSPNDPINSVLGATNYYWGTASYPNAGVSNKQAGVQYQVSTVGFKNLNVAYEQRASATASKFTRLQFTTNGMDFIDYPASSSFASASAWESRSFSLLGFPGVNNNPNFAVRVVSEFQSTASYGVSGNANYVGVTSSYGTGGTLSYDWVTISAEAVAGVNTAPTISSIANQTTPDNAPIVVTFTIGDAETDAAALSVTATSYDQNLISDGSIVPGGTGSSREITITPNSGVDGIVPLLVTVTDGDGDSTATWFYLTVNPPNLAPTLTQLPPTHTLANTPITIPFIIGDDGGVGSLTLSANSWNPNLVSLENISITGSGTNRSLTLTPATNKLGVAPITLSVNDGVNTTSTLFTLMVRPSTNVFFNDYFDYADGWIVDNSFKLWNTHSGTATQMVVTANALTVTGGNSEDCSALLIGQPFMTNGGAVLYASFQVTFTSLPSQAGAYLAHYKDANTGAQSGFGGRVWASTTNAAEGKYRLGVGNAEGTTNTTAQFPLDLELGTNYLVVTRFDPATGTNSTLWINPTSEGSPSAVATNVSTNPLQPNPIDVVAYAFRQATGEGVLSVDNLVVGRSFAAVVPVLTISQIGNDTVVSWDNSVLPLQAASLVSGVYTNVPGATSPYTNAATDPEKYFRLYAP